MPTQLRWVHTDGLGEFGDGAEFPGLQQIEPPVGPGHGDDQGLLDRRGLLGRAVGQDNFFPATPALEAHGDMDRDAAVLGMDRWLRAIRLGNLVWLPWYHGAPEGANQFYREADKVFSPYLPEAFETVTPEQVDLAMLALEAGQITLPDGNADSQPGPRVEIDQAAVDAFLRQANKADAQAAPPSSDWREWKERALSQLALEPIYGDLMTGERSSEGWLQCRDPESESGSESRSGNVADGSGKALRGTFHSWRTEETMSVFDFMVRRGVAANFIDAAKQVAQMTGVPLPVQSAVAPPRSTPSSSSTPGYPVIVVNNRQIRDIIWDAMQVVKAANARSPFLFRRAGRPVRLLQTSGCPQMDFVEDTAMYGILARTASWVKRTDDGDFDVPPPHDVAKDLVATADPDLPELDAVVSAPVFDQQGKLVSIPGYHPDAALWYHHVPGFSLPDEVFGESALLEAIEHLDPKTYSAPGKPGAVRAEIKPAKIPETAEEKLCVAVHPPVVAQPNPGPKQDGSLPFSRAVSAEAVAQVNSIRDAALAAGWTEAELFQTRGRFAFPCGGGYGVVCFLHGDRRIGQVTSRSIELICRDGQPRCGEF